MMGRNRILLSVLVVLIISTLGPALKTDHWPYPMTGIWVVAGMWAAIAWGEGVMSVRAATTLVALGLYQDLIHDAPLGAWPMAFLSTYLVGLAAHRLFPSRRDRLFATALSLVFGIGAALAGLALSAGIVGAPNPVGRDLLADLTATGMIYFLVRPLFTREGGFEEAL